MSKYEIECGLCGILDLGKFRSVLPDRLIPLVFGSIPNKTNCPSCDYPNQIIRLKTLEKGELTK